jgi:hypothetical protein
MLDRNDSLPSGRDTTSSDRQMDEVPQQDARTSGPWAGQHPTIIQSPSPLGHSDADARNAPVTTQAPSRNSHLARLVKAIQKSRGFQAAPRRRHYLQVVQEERQ